MTLFNKENTKKIKHCIEYSVLHHSILYNDERWCTLWHKLKSSFITSLASVEKVDECHIALIIIPFSYNTLSKTVDNL